MARAASTLALASMMQRVTLPVGIATVKLVGTVTVANGNAERASMELAALRDASVICSRHHVTL